NDEALSLYISLIHPDDRDGYINAAQRMLKGEVNELNYAYRIKNAKGEYSTVATYSKYRRDKCGNPEFYAGTVINYEKNDLIEPTTGLYTVKQMMESMEEFEITKKHYYLMLFSIRDFTSVNNKYGYITGNRVLRAVADIALLYKNGGNVFRLEGTKFAILKSFEPEDKAIETYGIKEFNHIKDQISKGIYIEDKKILIDIYGGAVYTDEPGIDPNTVYTSALYALSGAKENSGSEQLNVFNHTRLVENQKKLSVYNEIRESVMDGCRGFYLVYQPIISKKTGKLISMEALLRWYGEDFGEVYPDSFIGWLEKDPNFYSLGTWIFRKALEDVKDIIKVIPDFIVNINLAYPQLERDDFEEQLLKCVEESGVNPRNIRLELTERCRLLDKKLLKKRMEYIEKLGIQTAIDDFGTGYSAINLLFDLPTNQVKIDKTFIDNIENEEPKRILLKAITDCARCIGAHVCVEGIENKEIADFISSNFNVTSLQGYYYSKPIPLDEFKEKMQKWI
ncbi:MAG: EAL domain-containing protein, partial [Butyrivibrio sp.]|nr:EAL domain-containing protein [Butyrivibrio sp.]